MRLLSRFKFSTTTVLAKGCSGVQASGKEILEQGGERSTLKRKTTPEEEEENEVMRN
jgi:hypothetical protein